MQKNHKVIIIPGLGDNGRLTSWATNHWHKYELEPVVYLMDWRNPTRQLETKLNGLIKLIDQFIENKERVSLVGCSAGASASLNAFLERRNTIYKVISICGRLRTGNQQGFRSLNVRSKSSPSFAQSVKLFESREPLLSEQDKKKIMTVRALFGDELVPATTATLPGAYNITIPTPEHSLTIYAALGLLSRPIVNFLAANE